MSKYGKPKENLVGKTFGKLKVLDFAPREISNALLMCANVNVEIL